ncbi:MAG: S8 family serine peptidase [Phycisphaerales bacterium]
MPKASSLRAAPLACAAAAFALAGSATAQPDPGEPIRLRYAEFDPTHFTPAIPMNLRSPGDAGVYIVQLHERSNAASMDALRDAGAHIGRFLPENAYIVRMGARIANVVRTLPEVRWVGAYHPAYKLDEPMLHALSLGASAGPPVRYSIQLLERGPNLQAALSDAITRIGGTVHGGEPQGSRIEASLDLAQLVEVAHRPEVLFVDEKGAPEDDMDIVRLFSGADLLHDLGFSGRGVRGEVLDAGLLADHVDFRQRPPIIHGSNGPITSHGTPVYGILFGDGTGDARYRGMLPEAQGIFASYTELGLLGGLQTRYQHTAELVDEAGPYRAVFQSNSWCDPRTTDYPPISAQIGDIAILYDILLTPSQSPSGARPSRPQAWAKNIVSVGGIDHYRTLTRQDDSHLAGSTGPAADGRIKPDLAHFYDSIETTSGLGAREYTIFNGTSASTPIVAGHFGILYQLWAEGVLGNEIVTTGEVFDSRPGAITAKAIMINTARPWALADDLQRRHQGWGAPDVWNLYSARDELFVVDQSFSLLQPGDRASYTVDVGSLRGPLHITMAYLDPAGNPASTVHRINDLDLVVLSPDGVPYRGNSGMNDSLFTQPRGRFDRVNTVENVFVQSATPGTWSVDVIARELNEDANLATPGIDAHFALVIRGGETREQCRADFDGDGTLSVFDFISFQSSFVAGDIAADFDGDGLLRVFDYVLFQTRFTMGCP